VFGQNRGKAGDSSRGLFQEIPSIPAKNTYFSPFISKNIWYKNYDIGSEERTKGLTWERRLFETMLESPLKEEMNRQDEKGGDPMKSFISLGKFIFAFSVLLILIPNSSLAWSQQAQCGNVNGSLNVLTINLLFSEVKNRETRLTDIANFIKNNSGSVHLVLLQEVVGGALAGTINSSLDLQKLLADRGVKYNLSYTLANGLPGILSVGNSILSQCEILFSLSKTLPFESEEVFGNFEIPLKRKVLMSRINIPNSGKVDVYNTHLCSNCDPAARFQQAQVLMEFIRDVEKLIIGENPIILGGDFNTDLNIPDDRLVYQLITGGGFIDTWGSFNTCVGQSCCPGDGCTFAVFGDPYAVDPFTGQKETPERIDYIFEKGMHSIGKSTVVFDSFSWVSDHSGVLSNVILPY